MNALLNSFQNEASVFVCCTSGLVKHMVPISIANSCCSLEHARQHE